MTNKTLIVLRHAKSSWNDASLNDFDRPLNDRGRRDAPEMAQRLAGRIDCRPVIVTSPALRAVTTARVFADALDVEGSDLTELPGIYNAGMKTLVRLIEKFSEGWRHVILVGHNPGLSMLVEHLSGAGIGDLPTCAVVELRLGVDAWRAVGQGVAELVDYDYPKKVAV